MLNLFLYSFPSERTDFSQPFNYSCLAEVWGNSIMWEISRISDITNSNAHGCQAGDGNQTK